MENSSGKFLFGFLAGALTGAALGILLAPEKGEEVRRVIKTKVSDLSDKGKEVYNKYRNKGEVVEDETIEDIM